MLCYLVVCFREFVSVVFIPLFLTHRDIMLDIAFEILFVEKNVRPRMRT